MSHIQQPPYGAPYQSPQPGYGHLPPGSHFQQPPHPPPQHGYLPQGQFPPPTQGYHHAAPTPSQGGPFGHPPPQQHFGFQGPPQGHLSATGMTGAPSPGYDLSQPIPHGGQGAQRDAEALRSAMERIGTDEKTLIRILSKPDPYQMRVLVHTYNSLPSRKSRKTLEEKISSETSSYFEAGVTALVRGPLGQDVYLLNKGIRRLGTKESFLNDVLCGRSNADIKAIKSLYKKQYGRDLVADVKGDLSMKTETLFEMILAANRADESAYYDPTSIERDAMELHRAINSLVGKDQLTVCSILTSRSDNQIRGISHVYQQKYQTPLAKTIETKFSGHMEDALLLILGRATDPAMCTAEQLEATMKGLGTKDELLVQRVVRAHWNKTSLDQVKRAYKHRYSRDLISRVKSEVRGDVERLLVACLE